MSDLSIVNEDGVLKVTITCPDRLNSVTSQMLNQMADALEAADGVRVAVFGGEGRAFCSGAVMVPGAVDDQILAAIERVISAITKAPFPVLAAVNGLAAGLGSSLALACDLQVTKASGYFLQAFINVGLMGDGGAHMFLAETLGRARAARLLMLGERLPNKEAFAAGLVSHCVADDDFDRTVEELVERLANGPTMAFSRIKSAINAAAISQLDEVLALESAGQTVLGNSADHQEGILAFTQKRPANFTGA